MKKSKFTSLVAVIMLILLVATGCSSGNSVASTQGAGTSEVKNPTAGKLDKVTLQLKWLPQSQFMGYYVAKAKGDYKDAGIDIEILPASL